MNPAQLKSIGVLQSMDDQALIELASVLEQKEYCDGDVIFAEGDSGDAMYFIATGCVRVEKRGHGSASPNKTLAVLEAGDFFGEMALLDQKPRSAAAVAYGPVRAFRLSKTSFDELQRSQRPVGTGVLFAMIRTSGERIRRLSAHLVVYDEVGKVMGESRDLPALLDVILQQLASAASADWGIIVLRAEFAERLELRSQFRITLTEQQAEAIAQAKGFLGMLLLNPQDELVDSFEADPRFRACERLGFETASLILTPILVEGRFLGLIALGGKTESRFDLDTLNLTRGIARQAAQAILNARHREEEQSRSRHARQFVRF